MRDLVKNCLRMRPERNHRRRGRGPEAFDLLQAMNTGSRRLHEARGTAKQPAARPCRDPVMS